MSASMVGLQASDVVEVTLRRRGREVTLTRSAGGAWSGGSATLAAVVDRFLGIPSLRLFSGDAHRDIANDALARPPIFLEIADGAGRREHVTLALGAGRESVAFAPGGRCYCVPCVDAESLAAVLDVIAAGGVAVRAN